MQEYPLLVTLSKGGNYIEHIPIKVEQAIQGITLSKMRKSDSSKTKSLLALLCGKLNEAYGNELTESAIITLVESMVVKYYYLKFDEIAMVFFKAIGGHYDKYGKLNVAMVMKWLHEYDTEERQAYIESQAMQTSTGRADYFERLENQKKQDIRNRTEKRVNQLLANKEAERKVNK